MDEEEEQVKPNVDLPPYKPPVLFSPKTVKAKNQEKVKKYVELLRQLDIKPHSYKIYLKSHPMPNYLEKYY